MLKPIVTQVIPFDAMALQKALGDFASGTINVGKVVVEISPQR